MIFVVLTLIIFVLLLTVVCFMLYVDVRYLMKYTLTLRKDQNADYADATKAFKRIHDLEEKFRKLEETQR